VHGLSVLSARYAAPEVLNANYERLDRADIFALGATLYELALGSPLPQGERRSSCPSVLIPACQS
jgi:serine/threonine protein kinase